MTPFNKLGHVGVSLLRARHAGTAGHAFREVNFTVDKERRVEWVRGKLRAVLGY